VGVSRVRVYDWPGPDGARGGSPHLHTASAEAYVVVAGTGQVQTISAGGYAETPLEPGTVLWFTPGTVHRLVNGGGLAITVLMQNAGLPEAGDAVFTFPPDVLADPARYAEVAAAPAGDDAARRRRDLAVTGFLTLREGGPGALAELHEAAGRIVRDKAVGWQRIWRDGPLADAERTGEQLRALAAGDASHLGGAQLVTPAGAVPERYGMCGRLSPVQQTIPTIGAQR
jgi:hypothetical protein